MTGVLRAVRPGDLCGGLRSRGSHPLRVKVPAFCQCGWTGPTHPADNNAHRVERDELAAHLAATGHQAFPDGHPPPDHQACGHFHQLNDYCPAPPDSPTGRLARVTHLCTLADPDAALGRLAAAHHLGVWVDDQTAQAVIGARLAGCTWAQITHTTGADPETIRTWALMVAPYENAGILTPGD